MTAVSRFEFEAARDTRPTPSPPTLGRARWGRPAGADPLGGTGGAGPVGRDSVPAFKIFSYFVTPLSQSWFVLDDPTDTSDHWWQII